MDFVQDIIAKPVKIGTTVGLLRRIMVGDQIDPGWVVGVNPGVDVSGIGGGVLGYEGRLPMTGAAGYQYRHPSHDQDTN
jgi:hypothetical protein